MFKANYGASLAITIQLVFIYELELGRICLKYALVSDILLFFTYILFLAVNVAQQIFTTH